MLEGINLDLYYEDYMKVFLKILGGFFLYLITTLLVVLVGFYGGLKIAVEGPSDHF